MTDKPNQLLDRGEIELKMKEIFTAMLQDPTVFPSEIEMVKRVGIEIELPNFNLPYAEFVAELKEKYGLRLIRKDFFFGDEDMGDVIHIITTAPGKLEVLELFLDNINKEEKYSALQDLVANSSKTQCYVMNMEESSMISNLTYWVYTDIVPVEERVRKYALLNPEYSDVTQTEIDIIKGYTSLKLSDFDDIEAREKGSKREVLISMETTLDSYLSKGELLNYKYIVEAFLKIIELMESEG